MHSLVKSYIICHDVFFNLKPTMSWRSPYDKWGDGVSCTSSFFTAYVQIKYWLGQRELNHSLIEKYDAHGVWIPIAAAAKFFSKKIYLHKLCMYWFILHGKESWMHIPFCSIHYTKKWNFGVEYVEISTEHRVVLTSWKLTAVFV